MSDNHFQIFYGIEGMYKDVTEIALAQCLNNGILTIPAGDGNRAQIFGDPVGGVYKHIKIVNNDETKFYYEFTNAMFNINNNILIPIVNEVSTYWKSELSNFLDTKEKLDFIHKHLRLSYGSFNEEYPEQLIVTMFLKGSEKVLEIGANIGRNSLIISTLLETQKNLVTLECNHNIAKQVEYNRNINNYTFNSI